MADNVLSNVLGEGYQEVNAVQNGNAVYKNGKLQYFKIDIDQPGKYFFNLTDAFNASVDESNKIIPIQFVRGGGYLPLNGFNVSMDGTYPNGTTEFHVVGETQGANPAFINFNMPLGMFQAVGTYRFQFTITNTSTGEILKSPFQFFDVSQTATNLAIDLNNGIKPFDSEYTEWKNKVEQQINSLTSELTNLTTAADQLKDLMNQYVQNAEGYVQSEFTKFLSQENHFTVPQHFDGGATASDLNVGGGIAAGGKIYTSGDVQTDGKMTVGGDLTVNGSANLPANVTFNTDVLKYEDGNLSQGLFPCDGYWFASSDSSCVSSSLLNGVTGYISVKKFGYTPRDGDLESALFEIHMNCDIPTSAHGKPVVQFAGDFSGIDQTPFYMGGHIFEFDASAKTLNCNGYAPGNTSTSAMDAGMV